MMSSHFERWKCLWIPFMFFVCFQLVSGASTTNSLSKKLNEVVDSGKEAILDACYNTKDALREKGEYLKKGLQKVGEKVEGVLLKPESERFCHCDCHNGGRGKCTCDCPKHQEPKVTVTRSNCGKHINVHVQLPNNVY